MPVPALLAALGVALLVFVLYFPALDGEFLNWDDDIYVSKNPHLTDLGPGFVIHAFTSVTNSNYHPLTMISYALDHSLWGLDPWGYHLTNNILHAANSALVVLLVLSLIRAGGRGLSYGAAVAVSLLTGLLFGAHPLHVESVAWVSERKDVLYAVFYLTGMILYIRQTGLRRHVYAFVFFTLSILSKPMAVTFPVVLLILDCYPLGRFLPGAGWKGFFGLVLEKLPMFALALVLGAVTVLIQDSAIISAQELYWYERPLLAARGVGFYLYKFIWPVDLAPFYRANTLPLGLKDLGNIVFLSGVTGYCVYTFRTSRLWAALWAYYLVSLLPVLGFLQAGSQGAADRYTYLPLLGPMLLLALAVVQGIRRIFLHPAKHPPSSEARPVRGGRRVLLVLVLIVLVSVALGAMVSATRRQMTYWKDSLSLWQRELEVFRYEPLAYNQLANAYLGKGEYKKAEFYITTALQLNSRNPKYYYLRSQVYIARGWYRLALVDLEKVLELSPGHEDALYYRGVVFKMLSGR